MRRQGTAAETVATLCHRKARSVVLTNGSAFSALIPRPAWSNALATAAFVRNYATQLEARGHQRLRVQNVYMHDDPFSFQ